MKWIIIGLIFLPGVYANCENFSIKINEHPVRYNISFSQPAIFWVEDSNENSLIPKKVSRKYAIVPKETDEKAFLLAKPLNKKCTAIIKQEINLKKKEIHYYSPKKKLFNTIPFLFLGMIFGATILRICRSKP